MLHSHCLATSGNDFGSRFGGSVFVDVSDGDFCPFAGEGQRACFADSLTTAGDQRNFTRYLTHISVSDFMQRNSFNIDDPTLTSLEAGLLPFARKKTAKAGILSLKTFTSCPIDC
jgi:hypothetical protein